MINTDDQQMIVELLFFLQEKVSVEMKTQSILRCDVIQENQSQCLAEIV